MQMSNLHLCINQLHSFVYFKERHGQVHFSSSEETKRAETGQKGYTNGNNFQIPLVFNLVPISDPTALFVDRNMLFFSINMTTIQYFSCVGKANTNSSSQEDPKEMCWYAHYIFGNSMAMFRLQANQFFFFLKSDLFRQAVCTINCK